MRSRFQISELVWQDQSGVIFLAEDGSTGEKVALRRFFLGQGQSPGLEESERAGFLEAIELLRQLRHPSLRPVIEGGVDPVDGVPFIATQWVEGETLEGRLERGLLPPGEGELLVRQALEVMELLGSYFEVGAHWLKLAPLDVVVAQSQDGPRFTFWLSLARWMGIENGSQGLKELAALVETACGLGGAAMVPGGNSLRKWVGHVRESDPGVSEARGALDFIVRGTGGPVPAPVVQAAPVLAAGAPASPVSPPAHPVLVPPPVQPASAGRGLAIGLSIAAVTMVMAVSGFFLLKSRSTGTAKVDAAPEAVVVTIGGEKKSAPAAEKAAPGLLMAAEEEKEESIEERVARMREEIDREKGRSEFPAEEGREIRARMGKEVKVTGEVLEVRETEAWFVFEFGKERGANDICVILQKKDAKETDLDDLEDHEGQEVSFRGKVMQYRAGDTTRVCLVIDSLEAVGS